MKSYFGPYLNNPWLHGPFPLMHMVAGVPESGPRGRAMAPKSQKMRRDIRKRRPVTGFLIHSVTKCRDACVQLLFPVLPFDKDSFHH